MRFALPVGAVLCLVGLFLAQDVKSDHSRMKEEHAQVHEEHDALLKQLGKWQIEHRKALDALLQHVQGTRWEALFALALSTGLQSGELFGLHWEDIDLKRGVLAVRHSVECIGSSPRLGHSTIRQTMDRYAHLLPDGQDQAAGAFHRTRQTAIAANGCQTAVNSPPVVPLPESESA